ncbi:glycosyltransferase family 2 protein [Halosimplex salinum]|uniref:glycosyltransferase family 2 protein n=1 Tax=Halosimplex salinum TaxID=1710538 RepID=UPI000F47EA51|nr:glycosyltransferase family 2 protein [Halosimplex salinum]
MHATTTDLTANAATIDRTTDYRRVRPADPPDGGGSRTGSADESRAAATAYADTTVAVVVPAYNEAGRVGEVLDSIPPFVDRIYAVDDASTDDTWAEIRAPGPSGPGPPGADVDGRIMPIRHEENQGAGGALRTGYLTALDEGIDVTVTMDADGQMDPELMSALVDPVADGRADYAKGNRLADPEDRRAMPPFRRFGNWLLTYLTKIASGYWGVMDPQNGYTAISGDALAAVDVESLPDGHDYPNDLLVRLQVADRSVADVAMPAVYDDEESTIDYVEFVPATSLTLLRGVCWRIGRALVPENADPRTVVRGALVGVTVATWIALSRRDDAEGSSEE